MRATHFLVSMRPFVLLVASLVGLASASCKKDDANGGGAGPSPAPSSPTVHAASTAPASTAPAVPTEDVPGLVNTLEAATHAPDPEERAAILMQGCSEIPSCAGACGKALSTAASAGSTKAEKDGALAACFPEFARDHEKHALSRQDWIERYMAAYADRAAATLHGEDAKKLRALRAELHAP